MNPELIKQVLIALPLPLAWASAVMLAAWWARRENESARRAESRLAGGGPLRAGALALGGAMVLGALVYLGPDFFRARPGLETWPIFAALLAMALGMLERFWEGVRGLLWIFRAMLIVAIVTLLCDRVAAWDVGHKAAWMVGYSALTLITWWCWERTATRPGPAGALVFWVVASITSIALITTGSLKGAAVASWLAAACGGALLVSIVRPRAGSTLAGPGSTVFAVTIATLWFVGPNSGSMPLWMMFALAACAPAACLADLGPLKRLSPWKHAVVRAGLAAVPGVMVLGVALPQAIKDSDEESSGDLGAVGNPYPSAAV